MSGYWSIPYGPSSGRDIGVADYIREPIRVNVITGEAVEQQQHEEGRTG